MKYSGIYQILCSENNKRYIGASVNLHQRKNQHFYDLRHNIHRNPRLQEDFNNLKQKSFVFSILEIVKDKNNLTLREQYWIDKLLPEYNAELKAGHSVSHVTNPEVRRKISKTVKELWKDPEYHAKHCAPRNWKNGIPNRRGAKLSDETKEKIRQANLGENNPNYGKPRSQSFIDKMVKTYDGAISPDGVVYAPITHLRAFCRENNLDNGSMSKVLNGKVKSHKGWTKYESTE